MGQVENPPKAETPKSSPKPGTRPRSAPVIDELVPPSQEQIEKITSALSMLDEGEKEQVKAGWKEAGLPSMAYLAAADVDAVLNIISVVVNFLEEPVDAEVVEDDARG